ncbi:MAG: hypothetical protein E4H19_01485 [Chromatiales bacterium]|nr:MAG: hypothetical protein E4H19_01485 [Chromatiales bacterium]
MDVISEVLRQVRLTGAVLFRAELGAPWAVLTPASQRPPASTIALQRHSSAA